MIFFQEGQKKFMGGPFFFFVKKILFYRGAPHFILGGGGGFFFCGPKVFLRGGPKKDLEGIPNQKTGGGVFFGTGKKNPAYGRPSISRPMLIVAPRGG